MGNLLQLFQQLQQQGIDTRQLQQQQAAAQGQMQAQQLSMNAFRTANPPATGAPGLNGFENMANPAPQALPENAEPGVPLEQALPPEGTVA
jgi:hypothetical protein